MAEEDEQTQVPLDRLAAVETALKGDLKDFRRGGDQVDRSSSCVWQLAYWNNRTVPDFIEEAIKVLRNERDAKVLQSAFGMDPFDNENDLTERRRLLAEQMDVSERTISRFEDSAIERLAGGLARYAFKNSKGRQAIDEWLKGAENGPPPSRIPDDLPGLVDAQRLYIERILKKKSELDDDIAMLVKVQAKLEAMVGRKGN